MKNKTGRKGNWKGIFAALLALLMNACSPGTPQPPAEEAVSSGSASVQASSGEPAEEELVYFHDRKGALTEPYPVSAREAEITLYQPGDLAKLGRLTELRSLRLSFIDFQPEEITLEPLRGMVNLTELDAHNLGITDISPLAGLGKLRSLNLNDNQISDISPLAGLAGLEELRLYSNKITDLTPLEGLKNLKMLVLEGNPVSDLTPLSGLPEDAWLTLSGCNVPWDGWTPVSHVAQLFGAPPVENPGEERCPPDWVARIEAAYPGETITALDYDDYDGDGTPEAFAMLGARSDLQYGSVEKLLYVTQSTVEELESALPPMYVSGYFRFGTVKIIKVECLIAFTSSTSLL